MSFIPPSLLDWKPALRPGPVTLRGRNVTLEPLSAERHTAALWEACAGHDDLWRWMTNGPSATQAGLQEALAQREAATSAVFLAIVPAATGMAAGYASYMRIEPTHGVIEVGNVLLAPALQRTTAATEAMYLMASHAFEFLGYRRYEWKCDAENLPSRRAALRLGFTFEGIFRQHMVVKGRNRDTAWFSMLDREWPARKQALEAWLAPANFDGEGRQLQSLRQLQTAGS
ncbi:MAG: GNAT family protein [Terracidiphilus sp.]|nr:GNAT family protein [Terracidiphilus sp.]MDR3775266.1 GNAT family protein [Terracidiphilus sp.]